MLVLQILLVFIILVILFVIFLRHNFEFEFETPKIWKISYSNIFMKYSNGTDGGDFDFFIKLKPKTKETKEEIFPKEIKPGKPLGIREESRGGNEVKNSQNFSISSAQKQKEKPQKEKKEKPPKLEKTVKKPKEDDDIGEFPTEETDKPEKTFWDWVETAKRLWQREEKFVKSILKYVFRLIKMSLKLLTPAKINLSAEGGFVDPAETGWLYSVFIMLNQYFEKSKRINLNFTPQFQNPEWKASGQIVYSFSIARLLFFVFLILVSFPYFQTIKCWWRNRKYFKKKN